MIKTENMTGKEGWMKINTDDYNIMREFISEIELKLIQLSPEEQYEFYKPLKGIIFEAWVDACNIAKPNSIT